MSAVLGGAATKALGSRLPKPNVNVPGGGGKAIVIGEGMVQLKPQLKIYKAKVLMQNGIKLGVRIFLKEEK
ncbi:hypothetical protein LEP1GSC034_0019 [Leptospira interrogans str. 2003000735]|uniref:Uncharacterized protein n=4 Tax=Leptospira interrogans TaxID=173 RepID=A0A0E2DAR6_LEPIR|nr:hypothetical protein [Leptospira interrogans]EMF40694.1 hypothetical protein LEP1GSC067_3162 [Leptospira interrogans serovar Lora str. TE 1992]EMF69849.1 hypothetical protein LEP1GSC148_0455 [Leptospira interrogans serovar Canicola str. LT1962]EMY26646.1 hypothetical protein LEP1GSC115_2962 [Leptospira interrogans serovar Australis str. 200703203]AKH77530.1 hypothetical protein BRAT_11005 [Leptospira interrogans serovar Bratislava]EKN90614.1 hypothetical protein LEP1GSC027_1491 [Leptospira 